MRYVFFGTPRFAEIILGRLIKAKAVPAALVCNPDRPVGRKKVITAPETKMLVLKDAPDITILQPEKLDTAFIAELRSLKPDYFVVAAYAKIIPKDVLTIPRLGTLGVHPSLLPKYRGASPIQSVLLHGETETGSTIYLMDEKMDHGRILAQGKYALHEKDMFYESLEEKLALLSAQILLSHISAFAAGKLEPKVQDESKATYTKKFEASDGFVDEKDVADAENGNTPKAEKIIRTIHALTPEPGVWTQRSGKRIKLLGAIIQNGSLKLSKIQEEGGKPRDL
jgi:methionyl-tRNA formyltransferase